MATLTRYGVSISGTPATAIRATIQVFDAAGTGGGEITFFDAGATIPADVQSGTKILMHLPLTMFSAVLDLLRNEGPVELRFVGGRAFLNTLGEEPVGEGE